MKRILMATLLLVSANAFATEPTAITGCWYNPENTAHLQFVQDGHYSYSYNNTVTTGTWVKQGNNIVLTAKDHNKTTLVMEAKAIGMTLSCPTLPLMVKGDNTKCN